MAREWKWKWKLGGLACFNCWDGRSSGDWGVARAGGMMGEEGGTCMLVELRYFDSVASGWWSAVRLRVREMVART
jgi:hypothetical protein